MFRERDLAQPTADYDLGDGDFAQAEPAEFDYDDGAQRRQHRPRRSAAARRQQHLRAEYRIIQRLMRGYDAMAHRGCQPTMLGAALAHALAHGKGGFAEHTAEVDIGPTISPHNPVYNPKATPVCRHYLRGRCTYGQACRFSHASVQTAHGEGGFAQQPGGHANTYGHEYGDKYGTANAYGHAYGDGIANTSGHVYEEPTPEDGEYPTELDTRIGAQQVTEFDMDAPSRLFGCDGTLEPIPELSDHGDCDEHMGDHTTHGEGDTASHSASWNTFGNMELPEATTGVMAPSIAATSASCRGPFAAADNEAYGQARTDAHTTTHKLRSDSECATTGDNAHLPFSNNIQPIHIRVPPTIPCTTPMAPLESTPLGNKRANTPMHEVCNNHQEAPCRFLARSRIAAARTQQLHSVDNSAAARSQQLHSVDNGPWQALQPGFGIDGFTDPDPSNLHADDQVDQGEPNAPEQENPNNDDNTNAEIDQIIATLRNGVDIQRLDPDIVRKVLGRLKQRSRSRK